MPDFHWSFGCFVEAIDDTAKKGKSGHMTLTNPVIAHVVVKRGKGIFAYCDTAESGKERTEMRERHQRIR